MNGPAPLLRIERGSPGPQELAAVTAVLLAVLAAPDTGQDNTGRERRAVRRRTAATTVHRPTPRSWRTAP
ncbi:Acyl-CoA carboxylase epsilon subunit [Streptomyces sp. cf386]|uniref:acyl-CoA carboxylase subunit epsilon n=1 Tax=Streptomyces sp. cf386 TaxID=1761904 RepID=UPI00088F7DD3|nr:acyl-CoA carboxylase subunit epsilon [Streptomyces sp. cf386]SDP01738.1 Acyl-CoA carboxylase epsilon subunit [Streptomyces sp. cf386]